jgi:hypothetical protein
MIGTPIDDDILVSLCDRSRGVFRLNVDDFADDSEGEITSEEIHLTVIRTLPRPEDECPFCFKLSVISAVELVRQLNVAIAQRGGSS